MTRVRRLVAFVLELLLLQVGVLGGGMACAPGAVGAIVAPAGAAAAVGQATHAVAHHGGALHGAPHRAPNAHDEHAAAHCLLAGGCAAVAVTRPALLVATVTVVDRAPHGADAHLRRSARPAPEPPPPRG